MSYLQQLQQNNTNLQNLVTKAESLPDKEVSKLAQVADRTVTEVTATDLQGATSIGSYAFYYCENLAIIDIPNSVKKIGASAFYHCQKITAITIPDSVTVINNSAFYSCDGCTSVTIGSGVTKLATNAFAYCGQLKSVVIKSTVPPVIESSTFTSVSYDCVFTVPRGCGEAYKTATNWAAYADKIIEGDV